MVEILQEVVINNVDMSRTTPARVIIYYSIVQRPLTIVESITVQLTFSVTGLDLKKHVKLLFIPHKISR